jgi:hypothetical protein
VIERPTAGTAGRGVRLRRSTLERTPNLLDHDWSPVFLCWARRPTVARSLRSRPHPGSTPAARRARRTKVGVSRSATLTSDAAKPSPRSTTSAAVVCRLCVHRRERSAHRAVEFCAREAQHALDGRDVVAHLVQLLGEYLRDLGAADGGEPDRTAVPVEGIHEVDRPRRARVRVQRGAPGASTFT